MLEFHKQFREFRKAEKMTQTDMADFINSKIGVYGMGGTNQSTIAQMERGIRPVPIEYVKILHDHKDLNYEWWFERKGRRLRGKEDPNTKLTDISKIRGDYEYLQAKYNQLDNIVKKLYADFYEVVNKLNIK